MKGARNSKFCRCDESDSPIVQKQFAISEHGIVDDACFVTLLLIDRDSLDEIWIGRIINEFVTVTCHVGLER